MKRKKIEFGKTVLDNGVVIVSERVLGAESFSLGINVNFGSRDEEKGQEGIAHFMEHLIFQGSKSKTAKQIANLFENMGAYTNAFTTKDNTCFYVRALQSNFRKSLALLSEIVISPRLASKEIEKERKVILEEINSYKDDFEELIFDAGDKLLYGDNSLSHPILGYEKTVSKFSVEDLQNFHKNHYTASNLVIAYAGSLSHSKFVEMARPFFETMEAKTFDNKRELPNEISIYENIIKKDVSQAYLLLGKQVSGFDSDERNALIILNVLLGDGLSSRLYQNIREKRGLAYSIYSTIQMYNDIGSFYIYAELNPKNVELVKELIQKEFDEILKNGLGKQELKRAKEQIKSSIVMDLESLSSRMQAISKYELSKSQYEDTAERINKIEQVSNQDIQAIVQKYFADQNWCKALLIPKKNLG